MPKVSVIIPTYNSTRFVGQAVQSVLDQTFTDLEIIVVDDGSTDNTRQVVGSFSDQIQCISQNHSGPAEARNRGIMSARGEYVAFLDSDDVWLPHKLELQVGLLEVRRDLDIAYCDCYLTDEDGKIINRIRARHEGMILRPLLFEDVVTGSAGAVVLRRSCFAKTGLFDPALEALEDWDMWLRLSVHFAFGYVPQALVMVRRHDASRTTLVAAERQRQALQAIHRKLLSDPASAEELQGLHGQMQAAVHMFVGYLFYYQGATNQARREFLAAARANPLQRRAYLGLSKALLGRRLSSAARRMKWSLGRLLFARTKSLN